MPSPIRLATIRKQLESAGYRLVRISGSHHIFDRPGGPLVSIPVHNGMVKSGYGRRIQKIFRTDKEQQPKEQGESERPSPGKDPKGKQ